MPNNLFSYSAYRARGNQVEYQFDFFGFGKPVWKASFSHNQFFLLQYQKRDIAKHPSVFGVKFHIGVDDSLGEEANLASAWNIVKDILIENKVQSFKVVAPNGHFATNDVEKQYGKQITIYAGEDYRKSDIAFWSNLLQQIEIKLHSHGIKPDPSGKCSDQPILGSSYIRYRNDALVNSEYRNHIHCIKLLINLKAMYPEHLIFEQLPRLAHMPKQYLFEETKSSEEMMKLLQVDLHEEIDNFDINFLNALMHSGELLEELAGITNGPLSYYGQAQEHNAEMIDIVENIIISNDIEVASCPQRCSTGCIEKLLNCCKKKNNPRLEERLIEEDVTTTICEKIPDQPAAKTFGADNRTHRQSHDEETLKIG